MPPGHAPDDHDDRARLTETIADHVARHPDRPEIERRLVALHDAVAAQLDEAGRRQLDEVIATFGELADLGEQVALSVGLAAGRARAAAERDAVVADVAQAVAVFVADPRLDRGARLDVLLAAARAVLG